MQPIIVSITWEGTFWSRVRLLDQLHREGFSWAEMTRAWRATKHTTLTYQLEVPAESGGMVYAEVLKDILREELRKLADPAAVA